MSVKNRLTKYKLKLSLNFLQRLWTDSRSYFEWPSNGGPCSHCIFENKLLYAVVCISALYLDQLQSRHSPGTSTQGQTSVPNDAVLHFTPPPCWKRTLSSQCLQVLLGETETKVLSPSSGTGFFCHFKPVPSPLPLSSSWEAEAAIPCPTVLFWGLIS